MIESSSFAGASRWDASWAKFCLITTSMLGFRLLGNVEPEEMLRERDTVLERLAVDARKPCWSWARRVWLPVQAVPFSSLPSVGRSAG